MWPHSYRCENANVSWAAVKNHLRPPQCKWKYVIIHLQLYNFNLAHSCWLGLPGNQKDVNGTLKLATVLSPFALVPTRAQPYHKERAGPTEVCWLIDACNDLSVPKCSVQNWAEPLSLVETWLKRPRNTQNFVLFWFSPMPTSTAMLSKQRKHSTSFIFWQSVVIELNAAPTGQKREILCIAKRNNISAYLHTGRRSAIQMGRHTVKSGVRPLHLVLKCVFVIGWQWDDAGPHTFTLVFNMHHHCPHWHLMAIQSRSSTEQASSHYLVCGNKHNNTTVEPAAECISPLSHHSHDRHAELGRSAVKSAVVWTPACFLKQGWE